MAKEYGLITKKSQQSKIQRPSVFDGSDSDENSSKPAAKINLTLSKLQLIQIKKAQQSALKEDPSIYEYDEIFDEIKSNQKDVQETKKSADKSSKYIANLKVSAERRKKDYERHIERQVQKEREADADQYKDKESFVTSSYRKKIEEMKALEEQEKREEYLESIGEVTKQRDLGGFYRHIYEQKLGPKQSATATAAENKVFDVNETATKTIKSEVPEEEEEDENHASLSTEDLSTKLIQNKKERIYRKRKLPENDKSDDEDNGNRKQPKHLQYNLDADSDFSIDSDSEEDDDNEKNKIPSNDNVTSPIESNIKIEKNDADENVINVNDKVACKEKEDELKMPPPLPEPLVETNIPTPKIPPKIKIDKWKKRTVGDLFDAAVQRYFERKALRSAS